MEKEIMDASGMLDIENRIAELEKEVGHALFPITREEFVIQRLRLSDDIAKMQHIDMEWRRNNPAKMWLEYLEDIKREKDNNTTVWQKMRNWD